MNDVAHIFPHVQHNLLLYNFMDAVSALPSAGE